MFPWGLHCKCPCTHRETQPTSASPRGPPLPLGWSLDLLWALWEPLRLWSGPIPACAGPQSPQLPELDCFHLWEHSLSAQIFHRHRVYLADDGDLICSLNSWWKDFWSSSLVALFLRFSFGCIPTSPCGPPTGVWSWGCLGALGSAPVRTGRRGGMAAWITGPLVAPNAQGSWWSRAQETWPKWGPFLVFSIRCVRASPERASFIGAGVWGERGYNSGSSPCVWLSNSALLPWQSSLPP